eukprot:3874395-Rhodomonas_salina.1
MTMVLMADIFERKHALTKDGRAGKCGAERGAWMRRDHDTRKHAGQDSRLAAREKEGKTEEQNKEEEERRQKKSGEATGSQKSHRDGGGDGESSGDGVGGEREVLEVAEVVEARVEPEALARRRLLPDLALGLLIQISPR